MNAPLSQEMNTAINSDLACHILDAIGLESSKNAKQAMVESHLANPLFREICSLAYNPFRIFGVLPEKDAKGTGELWFDETGALEVLGQLERRELTGNAAREAVAKQLGQLSEKSGDLFIRLLRKDLRAGFSESTINKACKAIKIEALIPEFPYQRCSLVKDAKFKDWTWDKGVFSQEKADGMYANGNYPTGGTLFFVSRQGSAFPMDEFAQLVEEANKYLREDFQYHGELLVERDGKVLPREIGNGILNSVLKGGKFGENERPVYMVWDMIPMSAVMPKGLFKAPYANRFKVLWGLIKDASHIRMIPTRLVRSIAEAYKHCEELLLAGKEGTVIKNATAHWKDGTSKEQIKLKLEADCELEVLAINEGKAGSKNEGRAGALHCKSACGRLIVDVAVKNEKMRDEVDASPDDWIGRIITVRSNAVLNPSGSNVNYSLFLPRMVEAAYRTDKTEADTLERIQDQFNNAINNVQVGQ